MACLWVNLAEAEQLIVNEERTSHPNNHIRGRMLVLWLLHNGLICKQATEIAKASLVTVLRLVQAYRDGGPDTLRKWELEGPVSEMTVYRDIIRNSLEQRSVGTMTEVSQRIKELTGLDRKPTQVRNFLKESGFGWKRTRVVPIPPKKLDRALQRPFGIYPIAN